jgi:hypothetical protein
MLKLVTLLLLEKPYSLPFFNALEDLVVEEVKGKMPQ